MHVWLNYVVIEAKIVMQADLENKISIQFPDITNMSIDNMTAMVKIPTTIVSRVLEEGMNVHVSACASIHMHTNIHTHTHTHGKL